MKHTLLDQNLEGKGERIKFHIIVKGLLLLLVGYHLWNIWSFIDKFLTNGDFWKDNNIFSLLNTLFRLITLSAILEIYNYRKRGFYMFLIIELIYLLIIIIHSLRDMSNFMLFIIIYLIISVFKIGILWGILQIKNKAQRAWDVLK